MQALNREILLSFWKVHILHHAAHRPVYGQWILTELRRHGYDLSPGTLYPMLDRLEQRAWLARVRKRKGAGPAAGRRKEYALTPKGRQVLHQLRERVTELYEEVVRRAKR